MDIAATSSGNALAEELVQKWVADHVDQVTCYPVVASNIWLLVAGCSVWVVQGVKVLGDRRYAISENGHLTYIQDEEQRVAENADDLLTNDNLKTLVNLLPDGVKLGLLCVLENETATTFRNSAWFTGHIKIAEPERFAEVLDGWLDELSTANLSVKFTPGQIKAAIRAAVSEWDLPTPTGATSTKAAASSADTGPTSAGQTSPQAQPLSQAQLEQKYGDDEARKDLATNSSDAAVLRDLASDEHLGVQGFVASNRSTPVDAQELLSHHENPQLRGRLADRISVANATTAAIFARLAEEDAWQIRASVAKNQHAPESVLRQLADDEWPTVRVNLLTNPKLPQSVQRYLLQNDTEDQIREMARKYQQVPDDEIARRQRIEDQYGNKDRRQAFAEQCDDPEILREFARDWSDWVRFAVAGNENTPIDVLQALLNDDDEEVRVEARDRLNERGHPITPKPAVKKYKFGQKPA